MPGHEGPFQFRFHVRRGTRYETIEVIAPTSADAISALPVDVSSWDFAMWGDGSYRKAVTA